MDEQLQAFSGTTVNVHGGIVLRDFTSIGSTVNVFGGRIVHSFDATDSIVNIHGGIVDPFFNIYGSTLLNITGGSVGPDFLARTGTAVNVSGGSLESWGTEPGTVTNITGGSLGRARFLDGEVNIRGGTFGVNFTATHTSQVEIFGGEFRLNGNLIDGLDSIGNSVQFDLAAGDTLSGTLADGTPFAFSSWSDDSFAPGVLTLTAATLPTIGPSQIVASVGPVPLGIRQGQTLVVDQGAAVPNNFNAGRGSTLDVQTGGSIGQNLEAVSAS